MANTHDKTSMEEFADQTTDPMLEGMLKRFNQVNADDKPEPGSDADGLSDDAERIDGLAHIIWHLANQIEDIAYHNDSVGNMVTANAQCIRKDAKRIHQSFRTDDLRDF